MNVLESTNDFMSNNGKGTSLNRYLINGTGPMHDTNVSITNNLLLYFKRNMKRYDLILLVFHYCSLF